MKVKIYIFVLFLSLSLMGYSQHPVFQHLTEKDGLPDVEFYNVIEDKDGFIWLAADKGLYRYNGKEFKYYTHPDKRGLSVFGLKLDPKGRVWCNSISGQFFYVENDELILFEDYKDLAKDQLINFGFYNNKLIINGLFKLFEVDLSTKTLNKIYDGKVDNFSLSKNAILIQSKFDLVELLNDGTSQIYKNCFKHIKKPPYVIFSEFEDGILLYSWNPITYEPKLFLKQDTTITELSYPNKKDLKVLTGIYHNDNEIWFYGHNGVHVYQYNAGKITYLETLFKDEIITQVSKDINSNFWFSSLRNGVFVIPNINITEYETFKFKNKNITALDKVNDTQILFGSVDGYLSVLDLNTQIIDTIKLKSTRKVFSLVNNPHKGEVLISQSDKSYVLNQKKESFIETDLFNNAKDISIINDSIFLNTSYNRASIITVKDNLSEKMLRHKRAYTCYYSTKDKMYVGYVDNLIQYNERLDPTILKFKGKSIFAIDITETNDKSIWISTFNDGIIRLNNGKIIGNYTVENGLLSNQTSAIQGEGEFLWIITDKGVQRLDIKTNMFKYLTKTDGINSFNISGIVALEKEVFFGSNKGLFKINKHNVFKPIQSPKVYFTEVNIEDISEVIKTFYELPYYKNKIQFKFNVNGYLADENLIYEYRLNDINKDDDWSVVNPGVNEVTFNSLSAGQYEFQLRASHREDKTKLTLKTVNIKVNKPFYKTWWFIISVIGILSLLIIFYYKNKIRIKERQQALELERANQDKKMVALKLENLRSQMNPHFVFNALNSIQDYIVLNQKNLASDYLGKFADLMRKYLKHSDIGFVSIAEEIDCLTMYLDLEKVRFEDKLNYKIQIDKALHIDEYLIPTMLIQPYVENALKHGLLHKKNNRKLFLEFKMNQQENKITCVILDNGIGRKRAEEIKLKRYKQHNSFATKATQSRLELLNFEKNEKIGVFIEDLYDDIGACGTKVKLTIPVVTN